MTDSGRDKALIAVLRAAYERVHEAMVFTEEFAKEHKVDLDNEPSLASHHEAQGMIEAALAILGEKAED